MAINNATVSLWGIDIAVISWDEQQGVCDFQYLPEFIEYGIEVAPITMPLQTEPYRFPNLNKETYKGLPGMLADVLPDKFGNALIDQWLIKQKRSKQDFNPVERLCYTGTRAMGALEFHPEIQKSKNNKKQPIEISEMVTLANDVLNNKAYKLQGSDLNGDLDSKAFEYIYQVGTSAGGARAKAIINWNETQNIIVAGHELPEPGFESWLIKFDGVDENKDKEVLADPKGFGRIEYAYYLLAKRVGIAMSECRLLEESDRAHFSTKRFDRQGGKKIHKTSLCGMAHMDFNDNLNNAYEQAFQTARQLGLPKSDLEQLVKLMAFNVIYRNQDDHTKNIEFLMNQEGQWRLAPAFDLTFAYRPDGVWTRFHQLSINGKRDEFELKDLELAAKAAGFSAQKARSLIAEVDVGRQLWASFAEEAGVNNDRSLQIESHFRRLL